VLVYQHDHTIWFIWPLINLRMWSPSINLVICHSLRADLFNLLFITLIYENVVQWWTFWAVNHDYMVSNPAEVVIIILPFFLFSCRSFLRMLTILCLLTTVAASVHSKTWMLFFSFSSHFSNLMEHSDFVSTWWPLSYNLTKCKFYESEQSSLRKV